MKTKRISLTLESCLALGAALCATAAEPDEETLVQRFDFGSGPIRSGWTKVSPAHAYSRESGYGLDLESRVEAVRRSDGDDPRADFITGERPFYFSVALPEGNHTITLMLGDGAGTSAATVKAESRRLMLENVRTEQGEIATRSFTVNTRTPEIPGGGRVRLKERERPYPHWDDKLTLEFNGPRACLAAMEIRRAPEAVTVYLAGDSTVTDQPLEPWNSWGQMLPRFFKTGVAVANHAESGESIRSSLGARRFDKIFSAIRPGDYLVLQFGHNDMKDRAADALATYRSNLGRLVDRARESGALPVLVTSMERKAGVSQDTLGGYPETVRAVAQEKGAPLIDLHATSKTLYRALGGELDRAFQDGTHHNNYGSYELAKCVIEGIRQNRLALARFIVDDLPAFDPAHPDPVGRFDVPASPRRDPVKPEGD